MFWERMPFEKCPPDALAGLGGKEGEEKGKT